MVSTGNLKQKELERVSTGRYGMAIDLKKCIGCYSCVIACKVENGTQPGVFWARVIQREEGKYPTVRQVFLPMLCFHCVEAPCEEVCPTGATIKREDGIVYVDNTKCVGCRYCIMACPFDNRYFIDKMRTYFPGHTTPYEESKIEQFEHQRGVTQKCDFCMHRIDEGLRRGLKVGVDRDATPACVNACITNARYFGDLNDPNSEVSQLIAQRKGQQLHWELGTDPSVYYLW